MTCPTKTQRQRQRQRHRQRQKILHPVTVSSYQTPPLPSFLSSAPPPSCPSLSYRHFLPWCVSVYLFSKRGSRFYRCNSFFHFSSHILFLPYTFFYHILFSPIHLFSYPVYMCLSNTGTFTYIQLQLLPLFLPF